MKSNITNKIFSNYKFKFGKLGKVFESFMRDERLYILTCSMLLKNQQKKRSQKKMDRRQFGKETQIGNTPSDYQQFEEKHAVK